MRKQGVRPNLCDMYNQYLTNRRCSCTLSDKIVVASLIMGSPQGGILSPSCGWNCAMNKLLKRLRRTKTHCKAFADNGAQITRNTKLAQAMKDAQKAINVALEWAKEMGVELSVEKTVVMLFTNKRSSSFQMPKRPLNIRPRNTVLQDSKIPGCTLDDKLSWKPHIENKIKKAKQTLMAIRSVVGKSWGPSPECAKWSWTGVIRPAQTYGAIVWSRTASQAWAKKKLQQQWRCHRYTMSGRALPRQPWRLCKGCPPLTSSYKTVFKMGPSE
jgi:hypothetical protein